MANRVMIFTEDRKDQDRIEEACFNYLRKVFTKNYGDIEFQIFSEIADASKEFKKRIGAGGELFIVFDRKLNPRDPYVVVHSLRNDFRMASYEMSVNICDELNIPYFIYAGELRKEGSEGLAGKFNQKTDEIRQRWINLQ